MFGDSGDSGVTGPGVRRVRRVVEPSTKQLSGGEGLLCVGELG